jgi:hypothetical protein
MKGDASTGQSHSGASMVNGPLALHCDDAAGCVIAASPARTPPLTRGDGGIK